MYVCTSGDDVLGEPGERLVPAHHVGLQDGRHQLTQQDQVRLGQQTTAENESRNAARGRVRMHGQICLAGLSPNYQTSRAFEAPMAQQPPSVRGEEAWRPSVKRIEHGAWRRTTGVRKVMMSTSSTTPTCAGVPKAAFITSCTPTHRHTRKAPRQTRIWRKRRRIPIHLIMCSAIKSLRQAVPRRSAQTSGGWR